MKLKIVNLWLGVITAPCLVLVGCTSAPKLATRGLAVPWAGSYTVAGQPLAMQSGDSDGAKLLADGDVIIPRGEKSVSTDYQIGGISAYTVYTYDQQKIGLPGGTGYQYRSVVRSGISVP